MEIEWGFFILLPAVAFMYSAVGHGGASGYLALMALFGFSVVVMKPTALILNLFVAGVSFYHFYRQGHFRWKLFYPFILTSIPAAFIGGYINVDGEIYKAALGFLLLFAVVRMLGLFGKQQAEPVKVNLWQGFVAGAAIGFFSGLIGIGGGIILSPLMLLMGWANVKETAAISALFIWVNSLSGLTGLYFSGFEVHAQIALLVFLALLGGFAGSYYGSKVMKSVSLTRFLAFVLLLASVKLIFT